VSSRSKTWEALHFLWSKDNLPWLCAGDFNEIVNSVEQRGDNPWSGSQMEAFQECLSDYGLTDLGFLGYEFTWNNKREGDDNIQVRLDRGTTPFLALFPLTQVEHVVTEESDHMALIFRVQEELPIRVPAGRRGFQFEEM
jgi:hypothetical protein